MSTARAKFSGSAVRIWRTASGPPMPARITTAPRASCPVSDISDSDEIFSSSFARSWRKLAATGASSARSVAVAVATAGSSLRASSDSEPKLGIARSASFDVGAAGIAMSKSRLGRTSFGANSRTAGMSIGATSTVATSSTSLAPRSRSSASKSCASWPNCGVATVYAGASPASKSRALTSSVKDSAPYSAAGAGAVAWTGADSKDGISNDGRSNEAASASKDTASSDTASSDAASKGAPSNDMASSGASSTSIAATDGISNASTAGIAMDSSAGISIDSSAGMSIASSDGISIASAAATGGISISSIISNALSSSAYATSASFATWIASRSISSSSGSRPGGSTSSWRCSFAARWRTQRAASQPSRRAARSASSKITSIARSPSTSSNFSSASSTAGSSATSTVSTAAIRSDCGSSVDGSASITISPPASRSAARRRSHASPGLASNATRRDSPIVRALLGQQFEHVAQQFVLLVRLAEVTLHADVERALAMLLAGTRGDHDDRHVAQARVGLHGGREFVTVHARHFDVEQHQVGHALVQLFERIDAVLRGGDFEVVAFEHAAGDLAHRDRVVDHHDQRDAARFDLRRRRDVARHRGLAAHERCDVEDHDHRAVTHDGRAEDARHRTDLRAHRLDHDFAVADHLVDAHRGTQFARADQQQRHLQLAFGLRRGVAEQRAEVVQCVLFAAVGVGRIVLAERVARDAAHAAHRGDRHRVRGFADLDEHRLRDRERLRQAQRERRAFALLRLDVERAAELADFAGHHVHAHAAAGEAADGVGGGEAGLHDQRVEVGVGEHRIAEDQAALFGALADRGAVEAGAVVAHFQHDFRTFAAHRDADRAFLVLLVLLAFGRRFQAVRDRVAQHVFQRRGHALEHVAVEFALRAVQLELHVLAGVGR